MECSLSVVFEKYLPAAGFTVQQKKMQGGLARKPGCLPNSTVLRYSFGVMFVSVVMRYLEERYHVYARTNGPPFVARL